MISVLTGGVDPGDFRAPTSFRLRLLLALQQGLDVRGAEA